MTKEDALIGKVAKEMRAKLDANQGRSSWASVDPEDLLFRLRGQVLRLEDALRHTNENLVWGIVANVCNYAGMLGDKAERRIQRHGGPLLGEESDG